MVTQRILGVASNRRITESPEHRNAALAGPSATWPSGEVRNANVEWGVVRERGGRFKATHRARANSTQVNEYSEACENCGERGLGAPGDLSWKRPGEMVQITGIFRFSSRHYANYSYYVYVWSRPRPWASYVSRKIAIRRVPARVELPAWKGQLLTHAQPRDLIIATLIYVYPIH